MLQTNTDATILTRKLCLPIFILYWLQTCFASSTSYEGCVWPDQIKCDAHQHHGILDFLRNILLHRTLTYQRHRHSVSKVQFEAVMIVFRHRFQSCYNCHVNKRHEKAVWPSATLPLAAIRSYQFVEVVHSRHRLVVALYNIWLLSFMMKPLPMHRR